MVMASDGNHGNCGPIPKTGVVYQSVLKEARGSGWFQWLQDYTMTEIIRTSSVTNTQNEIYFASNAGLCFYSKSPYQFQGCYDEGDDGLPETFQRSLSSGDTIFVGTPSGVGLFSLSNETVYETWEANPDSLIAKTEIIGNKIYVALTNIGVARYDLSSGTWLSLWDEDNLLNSNEITSLKKDTNPNNLWVGGGGGLNLSTPQPNLRFFTGLEVLRNILEGETHIKITIINDILHYRYQCPTSVLLVTIWGKTVKEELTLTSSSTLSNLDAGLSRR